MFSLDQNSENIHNKCSVDKEINDKNSYIHRMAVLKITETATLADVVKNDHVSHYNENN
jgi:hypothetical protein